MKQNLVNLNNSGVLQVTVAVLSTWLFTGLLEPFFVSTILLGLTSIGLGITIGVITYLLVRKFVG
jgi:hypothetical protein